MRDDPFSGSDALDEGALLAAYLDGDTDEFTTAQLERRLATDPALATRLDALAAVRARLQRLAQVSAPAPVRRRLHERLAGERASAGTPVAVAPPDHRSRWSARAAGVFATAAAVVLVAVVGLGAVLSQAGQSDDSAGSAEIAADTRASSGAAGNADDPAAADGMRAAPEAGGTGGSLEAAESADEPVPTAPGAAKVDSDADIAARAQRLRSDPPTSLAARERQLRSQAGLSDARICVRDLEAVTVDLVDQDGRVALAVLVRDSATQIILLDPRTCAAIRTISTP